MKSYNRGYVELQQRLWEGSKTSHLVQKINCKVLTLLRQRFVLELGRKEEEGKKRRGKRRRRRRREMRRKKRAKRKRKKVRKKK